MILDQHIHLVGIGGAGLSAIATLLLEKGHIVSGSDICESESLANLRDMGAVVYIGHEASNVRDADLVLASSAIDADNPELLEAREKNIQMIKRQDLIGDLMADKIGCAVAGSHGKTTTTALISFCLLECGLDPTFIVGGTLKNNRMNARYGRGEPFVVEADEYAKMFLGLRPQVSIINSMDFDHPDCYDDQLELENTYWEFVKLIPFDGQLIVNQDDERAKRIGDKARELGISVVTYAIHNDADWRAKNIQIKNGIGCRFLLVNNDDQICQNIDTQLVGDHNVMNILASIAAIDFYGIDLQQVIDPLRRFAGVKRRFEIKGVEEGVVVVDDYAHHPTAIRSTLKAARMQFPDRKLWVVFQPHTYSRVNEFKLEIADSFEEADQVIITDIYGSRETNDSLTSSLQIVELMHHPNVTHMSSYDEIVKYLLSELVSGDIVITLNAGDGYMVGDQLLSMLSDKSNFSDRHFGLLSNIGKTLKSNEIMSKYTSSRIGGVADFFVQVNTIDDLVEVVSYCWQSDIPVLVLGSGSNVLFSDSGFRGLVVHNMAKQIVFDESDSSIVVRVSSGTMLAALARTCINRGYGGLEWAVSVPGTVGGALFGNAGAHGADMSDNIVLADILQRGKGIKTWTIDDLGLDYRFSKLQEIDEDFVILEAQFELERVAVDILRLRANEFVAHRKNTQPPGATIGSMFKNPPGNHAGRLIEDAGLKGFRIGQAEISKVHANFFVNLGEATAMDVFGLIEHADNVVEEKFGVKLDLEIKLIGEWVGLGINK